MKVNIFLNLNALSFTFYIHTYIHGNTPRHHDNNVVEEEKKILLLFYFMVDKLILLVQQSNI